jgi:hypothetical protein
LGLWYRLRPIPRGGRRLLKTTSSTTRTPSAMNAHEIMPIQFIFFEAAVLLATELKGLFSKTLPTLGSEISLEDDPEYKLELSWDNSPEEEGREEEDTFCESFFFTRFLELADEERDEAKEDEDAAWEETAWLLAEAL